MSERKLFELSELTRSIVAFLKTQDKGVRVDYRELSRIVGSKVESTNHNLLYARMILRRDHAQIWLPIRPRIGVRRLNDLEITEHIPQFFHNGARNKLNLGDKFRETVDLHQLDSDMQVRFSVDAIQAELALDALSKAQRRKIERVARGTSNDLPSFNAIEWAISLMPKNRMER
jgi:hypothetical protein